MGARCRPTVCGARQLHPRRGRVGRPVQVQVSGLPRAAQNRRGQFAIRLTGRWRLIVGAYRVESRTDGRQCGGLPWLAWTRGADSEVWPDRAIHPGVYLGEEIAAHGLNPDGTRSPYGAPRPSHQRGRPWPQGNLRGDCARTGACTRDTGTGLAQPPVEVRARPSAARGNTGSGGASGLVDAVPCHGDGATRLD